MSRPISLGQLLDKQFPPRPAIPPNSVGEGLAWEVLVELEPRLAALYQRAGAIKDNKRRRSFCANAVWYGRGGRPGLKERLCRLVGWSVRRRGAKLAPSLAYDICYQRIYDVLPPCRNCCCIDVSAIFGRGPRAKAAG